MVEPARLWFNGLPDGCIESWAYFFDRLTAYFTSRKRQLVTIAALSSIMQGENESLQTYINQSTQVEMEVDGAEEAFQCWIFKNGLLRNHPSRTKLGKK